PSVLERAERGALANPAGRRLIATWLRTIDRAIPRDPEIDAFLRKARPDVLAVTPLIEPGSPQAEYLRSARGLGIRTAFCVASWDNLTNKGLIHGPVDLVAVWNDSMKREAVDLHGVPPERVAVTGAAAFDHWFDWRPRVAREQVCGPIARMCFTCARRSSSRRKKCPSSGNGPGRFAKHPLPCCGTPAF